MRKYKYSVINHGKRHTYHHYTDSVPSAVVDHLLRTYPYAEYLNLTYIYKGKTIRISIM